VTHSEDSLAATDQTSSKYLTNAVLLGLMLTQLEQSLTQQFKLQTQNDSDT